MLVNGSFPSSLKLNTLKISFGSLFWPNDPERLWAIVDELIRAEVPLVFAQASPFTVVPQHMAAAIDANPISLALSWVPQERLLMHPSVGWFITHGGWNSVQEALLAKVPLYVIISTGI